MNFGPEEIVDMAIVNLFIEVRDSPNGIFHPCTLWAVGLARQKHCRRVVVVAAVGVILFFLGGCRPPHLPL